MSYLFQPLARLDTEKLSAVPVNEMVLPIFSMSLHMSINNQKHSSQMCPEAALLIHSRPCQVHNHYKPTQRDRHKSSQGNYANITEIVTQLCSGQRRKMFGRIERRSKAALSLRAPKHTTLKNSSKSV